jgi:transcriptional regulator with XRE-family HTH domain
VRRTRSAKLGNIVGQRVRAARLALKPRVSQEDLSARLSSRFNVDISQGSLSKIESGQRQLRDFEIVALAKVLRVKVGWLFGE